MKGQNMMSMISSNVCYDEMINNNPLIDAEEETRLATIIRKGRGKQAARHKLFNANIRLVIKQANKAHSTYNMPLEDLVSEGSIALMNAIDNFNPDKFKTRFSTYACKCIMLHLNKAVIDFNKNVHVPQNILLKLKKYKEMIEKDPDMNREEARKELNLSKKAFSKVESHNIALIPLNSKIHGGTETTDEATLESVIPDEKAPDPYENVAKKEEKAMLRTALSVLNKQEKDIIEKRYFGNDKITLDVLGKKYGVSKERIRQQEEVALNKMKRFIKRSGYRD